MTRGKPLRFLALALAGWAAVRAAMLLPGGTPGDRREVLHPHPAARASTPGGHAEWQVTIAGPALALHPGAGRGPVALDGVAKGDPLPSSAWRLGPGVRRGGTETEAAIDDGQPSAISRNDERTDAAAEVGADIGLPWTATGETLTAQRSRLHGSTWLIARPSGGDTLSFGQLGASQAGMRLTYAVSAVHHLELSARASAPLRDRGREAALGLDWQPTRLPVHLLAEQRLPLDGGRTRPAVQLIAGAAVRLPLRLQAEAYLQAGGVHRRGGFADGAARLSRRLLATRLLILDLGTGTWAAAQRQVSRVDVGPTLGLTLPARDGSIRLAVDYRLRVAGQARPGSGPAVSVGSSF